MLHNWLNHHDLIRLAEKVRDGNLRRVLGRFFLPSAKRVQKAWHAGASPPVHWWDIPAVRRRWNRKITGDENTDHYAYFTQKYFGREGRLVALSPGCGRGEVERRWAAEGAFARIEGVDLSPDRIAYARRQARRDGLDHLLHFSVGDVHRLDWRESAYDIVIFEGALHHFSGIDRVLKKAARALKPDGYLFLNEFVGPARFQWTDRQLQAVNGLLHVLPERFRVRYGTSRLKRQVYRPGKLWMLLSDPSEAVESDRIRTAVKRYFEPVEEKEYGGTVLSLLFSEIAHNFLTEENGARTWLQFCFDAEDLLLEQGELTSDYLMGLYRPRREIKPGRA